VGGIAWGVEQTNIKLTNTDEGEGTNASIEQDYSPDIVPRVDTAARPAQQRRGLYYDFFKLISLLKAAGGWSKREAHFPAEP
jgi:hypothetical protein